MTEDDVVRLVSALPDVDTVTASRENGAPEIAWGDTFFSYDPGGELPPDRKFPFVTVVTKDYTGFDTASQLDRPGVFRVNIAVGRIAFEDLFGHAPAAFEEHRGEYDYTALDRVIPHPVYATQGWVSILSPGPGASDDLRRLVELAHERAARRRRPR